jgi:hypothetical protein
VADWRALLDPERIRREGYFNPATVDAPAHRLPAAGFSLNQTFDIDLMMVILSFQILLEEFQLPSHHETPYRRTQIDTPSGKDLLPRYLA